MIEKESMEDRFRELLIKDKELSYVMKNHAITSINYMAKCLKEKEVNTSGFQNALWNIQDFFDRFYLRYLKIKNEIQLRFITDEDKKEQVIGYKKNKSKELYFHFYIIKKFQSRLLVRDIGSVDISNFEYQVYLKVEYSEIITKEHFKKTFAKEINAIKYFNELIENNKNKSGIQIINNITNNVDNEITSILEHTKYLKSKFYNNC